MEAVSERIISACMPFHFVQHDTLRSSEIANTTPAGAGHNYLTYGIASQHQLK